MICARPHFYTISNNPHISLTVLDCSFFTRRVVVTTKYTNRLINTNKLNNLRVTTLGKQLQLDFSFLQGRNNSFRKNLTNLQSEEYLLQ